MRQFINMDLGCILNALFHRSGRGIVYYAKRKREEIWLSPMTKNPYTHRKIQKETWQHKNATKNFDNTTIAELT